MSQPNRLRITEEQFNNCYPDLAGHYNFFNDPVPAGISDEEFERRYLSNKLWRLNNCYTVIDKYGNKVPFIMNLSQHIVYGASRIYSRIIILKSRQQGISTFWLISYFDDCMVSEHLQVGLMAQGTDEASTLLERSKLLWDELNGSVKAFFNVALDKDNSKEFSFNNRSTIFIRVSFRSATLQRLHCSEFGKIANNYPKRAKETKTGTLQALGKGNTGVIESTAEGKNMFKTMWDQAELVKSTGEFSHKDFYPVFLSWMDDPDCTSDIYQSPTEVSDTYFEKLTKESGRILTQEQKNFWIIQYRELGGDIHQEYPGTPDEAFLASKDGTYYSRLFKEYVVKNKRVVSGLYDPNLPVDAYFDIGVDDYGVVGLMQWYRGEWRIIDEFYDEGYSIQHYIKEIDRRGYKIRSWKFPHDIKVREAGAAGTNYKALSRTEIVEEFLAKECIGGDVEALDRVAIIDGIEAVRRIIPNLRVDSRCEYLIDCFYNYTKKWDDKLEKWMDTPLHDEYSHGADVIRGMALETVELESYNHSPYEDAYNRSSSNVRSFAV